MSCLPSVGQGDAKPKKSDKKIAKELEDEVKKTLQPLQLYGLTMLTDAGCPYTERFLPAGHEKWRDLEGYDSHMKGHLAKVRWYESSLAQAVEQGAQQLVYLFPNDPSSLLARLKLGTLGMMKTPFVVVTKKDSPNAPPVRAYNKAMIARYGLKNFKHIETETLDEKCAAAVLKAVDTSLPTVFWWKDTTITPPPAGMAMLKAIMQEFPDTWLLTNLMSPDAIKMTKMWTQGFLKQLNTKDADAPGVAQGKQLCEIIGKYMNHSYSNDNFDMLLGADKRFGTVREWEQHQTNYVLYSTVMATWDKLSEEDQKEMEKAEGVITEDTAVWVAQMKHDEGVDKLVGQFLPKDSETWRKIPFYAMTKIALKWRTLFMDRAVRTAVKQGAEQVLELGSGLSTRCARLKDIGVPYYEVDMGDWFENKCTTLQKKYELKDYHFKHMNYIKEDPIKALNIPPKRTVVIWEGNSMYIPRELVLEKIPKILGHFEEVWWGLDYFLTGSSKMMKTYMNGLAKSKDIHEKRYWRVVNLWISDYSEKEITGILGDSKPFKCVFERPVRGSGVDSNTAFYTTSTKNWPEEGADTEKDVQDGPLEKWAAANPGPYA